MSKSWEIDGKREQKMEETLAQQGPYRLIEQKDWEGNVVGWKIVQDVGQEYVLVKERTIWDGWTEESSRMMFWETMEYELMRGYEG